MIQSISKLLLLFSLLLFLASLFDMLFTGIIYIILIQQFKWNMVNIKNYNQLKFTRKISSNDKKKAKSFDYY